MPDGFTRWVRLAMCSVSTRRPAISLWSHDCVNEMQAKIPDWGLAASPIIWQNLVIVHAGVPGGSFVAFDRLSAAKKCGARCNDPAGYATPIIVERTYGQQLVGWTPENIVGIALDTGHVDWRVPYKVTYGVSIATPIVRNDLVFVSGYWEGSKAIRLGPEPADAALAWEDTKNLRGLMSQPLERDGYVYSLDKQFGRDLLRTCDGQEALGRWQSPHAARPQSASHNGVARRRRPHDFLELRRGTGAGSLHAGRLRRAIAHQDHRPHLGTSGLRRPARLCS